MKFKTFRITDVENNSTHADNAAYCISKSMSCKLADGKRDQVVVPDIFSVDDIIAHLKKNSFNVGKLKIEKC